MRLYINLPCESIVFTTPSDQVSFGLISFNQVKYRDIVTFDWHLLAVTLLRLVRDTTWVNRVEPHVMELKMQRKDNWNGRTIGILEYCTVRWQIPITYPPHINGKEPLAAIVQQSLFLLTTWPNDDQSWTPLSASLPHPFGYERYSLLVELLTLRLVSNDDRFHLSWRYLRLHFLFIPGRRSFPWLRAFPWGSHSFPSVRSALT